MISANDKVVLIQWKMNLLKRAIDTYGVDKQIDMLIEECAELIVALKHMKRGRVAWNEVAEEMADVKIMIDQFHTIDTVSDAIHNNEMIKLQRLEKRLNEK